ALPPLPAARGGGALVRLGRDLHYFGGTERTSDGAYRWDDGEHWALSLDAPTAWHALAPLPNPRNHLGGAVLGGQIYAIGGQHLGDEAYGDLTEVDRYDPATNTWSPVAPLPLPLGHITGSTVVWNARIVVTGGVTLASHGSAIEGQESDVVLAYDPAGNEWTPLTSLPGPRQSPVADTIGGALVVTTGSTAAGPVDSTFVSY
uniref:Kelch repeat-containing protein n=1 Tax=Deinococcus sp. TaxID=47478 RepID=UPI00286996D7